MSDSRDQIEGDESPQNLSPFNAIPPVIVLFAGTILVLEVIFTLAKYQLIGGPNAVQWWGLAIDQYAFFPEAFDRVIYQGDFSWPLIRRFVTYPFFHQGFLQALFVAALVLAMGKFLGDRWSQLSLTLLMLIVTIGGATLYGFGVPNLPGAGGELARNTYPLFTATTTVYGMIGAFTYTRWLELRLRGDNQWKAFRLIGMLMAVRLLYAIFIGGSPHWIAELSAFFIGLGISPVLAPGGWSAFVARLRERSS